MNDSFSQIQSQSQSQNWLDSTVVKIDKSVQFCPTLHEAMLELRKLEDFILNPEKYQEKNENELDMENADDDNRILQELDLNPASNLQNDPL